MNSANVRDVCVLPAVVIDHRPRCIQVTRLADHALDVRVLPRVFVREPGKSHAFIHRHPGDDAGMVVIAFHRTLPFGRKSFFRFHRPLARVWHFFPNQNSKPVTPVQPTRVFDLLMLPNSIETKGLAPTDVRLQRLVRRRSQITIRPVTLIEHHLQIRALSVQHYTAIAQLQATQTEIRTNLIQ